jgi:hypothetical protein
MRFIWLMLVVVPLAACGAGYEGDGTLQDRGWSVAIDRYVLDLGVVLPNEGKRDYRLKGLPPAEFTLGFEFVSLRPDGARELCQELGVLGELALARAAGGAVLQHRQPLHEWTWTCGVSGCENAFAYLRGQELEEELDSGGIRKHAVRGSLDSAWGTYFRPARGEAYALRAVLANADQLPAGLEIRLVGRGGGWK